MYKTVLTCLVSLVLAGCTLSNREDRRAYYQKTTADSSVAGLHFSPHFDGDAPLPIGGTDRFLRCGGPTGPVGTYGTSPIYPTAGTAVDRVLSSFLYDDERFAHQAFSAAVRHDMCYVHGRGSYGLSTVDCDADITTQNRQICYSARKHNRLDALFGLLRLKTDYRGISQPHKVGAAGISTAACMMRMNAVDLILGIGGPAAQLGNPNTNCPYGRGFMPARDVHLIAGRFLGPNELLLTIGKDRYGVLILGAQDPVSGKPQWYQRIKMADVPVTGLPDARVNGLPCLQRDSCKLADLQIKPDHLFSFSPTAIDANGDGRDEVLLMAFDRKRWGAIAVLISKQTGEEAVAKAFALPPASRSAINTVHSFSTHDSRLTSMPHAEDLRSELLAFDGRVLTVPLPQTFPDVTGDSIMIVAENASGITLRAFGFELSLETGAAIGISAKHGFFSDDRSAAHRCGPGAPLCDTWEDALMFARLNYEPFAFSTKGDPGRDPRLGVFYRPRLETEFKDIFSDLDPFAVAENDFSNVILQRWPSTIFSRIKDLPPASSPRALLEGAETTSGIRLPIELYPWHFIQNDEMRNASHVLDAAENSDLRLINAMIRNDELLFDGEQGADRGHNRDQHIAISEVPLGGVLAGEVVTPETNTTVFMPPSDWTQAKGPSGSERRFLHKYFWVAPVVGPLGPNAEPAYLFTRPAQLGCSDEKPFCSKAGRGEFEVLWVWRERDTGTWLSRALICQGYGIGFDRAEHAAAVLPVVVRGSDGESGAVVYARRAGVRLRKLHMHVQGGALWTSSADSILPGSDIGSPCKTHPQQWSRLSASH